MLNMMTRPESGTVRAGWWITSESEWPPLGTVTIGIPIIRIIVWITIISIPIIKIIIQFFVIDFCLGDKWKLHERVEL